MRRRAPKPVLPTALGACGMSAVLQRTDGERRSVGYRHYRVTFTVSDYARPTSSGWRTSHTPFDRSISRRRARASAVLRGFCLPKISGEEASGSLPHSKGAQRSIAQFRGVTLATLSHFDDALHQSRTRFFLSPRRSGDAASKRLPSRLVGLNDATDRFQIERKMSDVGHDSAHVGTGGRGTGSTATGPRLSPTSGDARVCAQSHKIASCFRSEIRSV